MSRNNQHLNFFLLICLFSVSPQGSRSVVCLLRHHSLSPWHSTWYTVAHRRCSINIWKMNALAFKIHRLFTRWWPSSFSWWDSKHLLVSEKWVSLLQSHLLQVCFGHTEADALWLGEEEPCIFRILPGKERNVEYEGLFKVQNCCECTDILSICFKINEKLISNFKIN